VAGSSGTYTITNVPDGQYQVNITPIYADGRSCTPTTVITEPCPGLLSINAVLNSGNIVVSYLAPSQVPKVRITVDYPNGGSFIANYVNNGNNIVIPLPPGVTGIFTVSGQSVCDESAGFFSASSPQISLTIAGFNVTASNQVAGITVTAINGISGFALPILLTNGASYNGNHVAFFGSISIPYTGTPGVSSSAVLELNGTIIQCQNVPGTSGGTIVFSAAAFSDSDQITIIFNNGTCP
jgi:hypothetical protein